jgi:hypothetical protein
MNSTVRLALRFGVLAGVFAFVQVALLAFSGSILMGRGVHRLDHPEFPVTAVDRTCQALVIVLQEPYESLKRLSVSRPGGWIDFLAGSANSLMWGSVAAFLFLRIRRTGTHKPKLNE